MTTFLSKSTERAAKAFTLVEMVVVIAILTILMGAGISLIGGTGGQARKAGADMITGMVEQARSLAINSRTDISLVIAEPGTFEGTDERCRIGLIREKKLTTPQSQPTSPGAPPPPKTYELIRRWQTLNTGVVLLGDDVDGIPNPVSEGKKVTLSIEQGGKNVSANVYQIMINSMGSLKIPEGSSPIILRLAEGGYRGNGNSKKPVANKVEGGSGIAETQVRIGRVIARAYRNN